MRLLDAKKFELVDVRDDEIPPYAILSHTWGDEEITLQELHHMKGRMPSPLDKRKRTIADKKGFVKIKKAAALAVKRGFSYIWVDTCCIDKSSSAELSEAINSMYLWYQQSQECYAYLSDVNSAEEEDWGWNYSSLRRSRWFRRGWTLQELIAPKAVHFYARDWSLLGHKDGPIPFMKIISELTCIDAEVLDGRTDPLQLSISARMKWASHRETTRLEDTAYCLMGLFQVNMPLLYGEGHRAFTRLQEEIIQRTDDQSLYAWNSFDDAEEDPDALSGLLARSPEQFKSAGNIQPLPPSPVHASAPSGTTNHGLRVQLYLRRILEADGAPMEEDYYAILDCFIQVGDLYECPVIRLRRLFQDQYARFQTKSRKFLPPMKAEFEFPEYEGYRTIYVRKQPIYYHLPQFRISPLHMRNQLYYDKNRQDYELVEIFPPRQWNSTTMTMRVKYSRKLQAMGVFRFQSPHSHDKTVDVVVGVRRLDAMRWEGWCFQRSCQGEPLGTTLAFINQKISDLTGTKKTLISPGILRDSFGADSRLLTNATVEGMQLQGRLYISISISLKPEIQTSATVESLTTGLVFPTRDSHIRVPLLRYFQVRTVTGPCCQAYQPTNPVLLNTRTSTYPLAVRGRPSTSNAWIVHQGTSNESSFKAYCLMKPLHDFLAHVVQQKLGTDPPEPLEDLAQALFFGNSDEIESLLGTEIDLNAQTLDPYGLAPLHWAVVGGFTESIDAVLKKGADPLSVTREGWTAIHVSAIFNKPAWKTITAWPISSENLEKLANNRTKDHLETPLHLAAAYSSSDIGPSFFNDLSRDVLTHATLFSRNKYDETPLHRAAACNNIDIIRSIISQCKDSRNYFIDVVDRYGRTPLWHAAATGSLDTVQYLISLNASINLTDDLGRSPLHAACRGGHHETAKHLLQEGARQSSETSILGLTALDYAALFGHIKCLRHLLHFSSRNHAMLATAGFPSRHKALHIAATCGWLDCVKVLCRSRADPRKTYPYYLILDKWKTSAIVVEKEGDAVSASTQEGNIAIIQYLKTLDDYIPFADECDSEPEDLYYDNNSTSTQPVVFPQSSAPTQPYAPAQQHKSQQSYDAYAPPQSQEPSTPPTNYQSLDPRYTSGSEPYRESIVARPSAPFVDKPPGVGSHSVTLPAYPSLAYQLGSEVSKIHNLLQSSDPYPRYGSSSAQDPRQQFVSYSYSTHQAGLSSTPGPRQHSLGYTYSTPQAGLPSYRGGPPAPLPYPTEPDERYSSLPGPNRYYSEPPRPLSPGLGIYSQPTFQTTSLRANLVRMLGSIGNPSMLVEDSPIRAYVYQAHGTEGAAAWDNKMPIYELATGDESNIVNAPGPSVSVLSPVAEGFGPMAGREPDGNETQNLPHPVSTLVPLGSSIQSPGSWDKLT
jgi:ankyrin repeat protein